jgi:hypothetical protein
MLISDTRAVVLQGPLREAGMLPARIRHRCPYSTAERMRAQPDSDCGFDGVSDCSADSRVGEGLKAEIWKGRRFALPSPASRSCDVVDPPAKKVSNFQAAGKIVILVHKLLVLVLQQAAR